MKWKEENFQHWEYCWLSRTMRIATKRTTSAMIKVSSPPDKEQNRNLAARSKVSGYGRLVAGIEKHLSKSLAFFCQS